jgi:hypothetical protein
MRNLGTGTQQYSCGCGKSREPRDLAEVRIRVRDT